MDTVVRLIPDHMFVRILSVEALERGIAERALLAVNEVAARVEEKALDLVPVRKVFRYGRTLSGLRMQGRQETRTLSLREALAESEIRQRFGLPSAFPTDAAGRRIPGSRPLVRTAQLTENYRSRNRANTFAGGSKASRGRFEIRDKARRTIIRGEAQLDSRGRQYGFEFFKDGPRLADPEAQADLSAAGRRELARATGDELGGGLRDSIHFQRATLGVVMTAHVSAGNKEVKYAKYVEFGTRHARAQPFMRPALAQARQEYVRTMRRALKTGKVG